MGNLQDAYRGCFLGLAVGDAMGYTVDDNTWEEIRATYGPNGLLGYDLVNGYANVTSYTQLAAYTANGLLVGYSRGRTDNYLRYITLAMREWAKRQHFPRDPEGSPFWIAKLPELRRRHNRDARTLDALRFETLGTPDTPINQAGAPGAITMAVAIGLFFNPKRMEPAQIGILTAEAISLTHGDPEAFLSGVVLAYAIAGILQEPEHSLKEHFSQAVSVMQTQFSRFSQVESVARTLRKAIVMAEDFSRTPLEGMEHIGCCTSPECLAGAMYACLCHSNDFDNAMITAVNHSGLSAAVGAITGALLGAKLGAEALPEFYLESLEPVAALSQLAEDLSRGTLTSSLFDTEWDQKYVQGLPLI